MADYIDRQAAIAALRKFAEDCKGSTEAATAVSVAISVLSQVPSPWENAKENPPEKNGDYLCYYKFAGSDHGEDGSIGELFYFASYDRPRFEGAYDALVTHWMPLPDAPEE